MVTVEEAVIARIETGGQKFEILIEPDAAEKYKESKEIDWEESLVTDEIWSDSKKGDRPSEEALNEAFGTLEKNEIFEIILNKGNIQLTTEQRRKLVESKSKQIIAHIVAIAMNHQTETPHPPQRIENALNEARFVIDPFASVEVQVERAVNEIKMKIPISMESFDVAVKVPSRYVGKSYGEIKEFSKRIKNEEYMNDGTWIAVIDIAAGSYKKLTDRLNSITKGDVETKILN